MSLVEWSRAEQQSFIMRDFFTFAKHSGMCPDITEEEYREVCAWLQSRIPRARNRANIRRQFGLYMMPRLTFKSSLIQALCVYAMLLDLIEIGRIDIRIVLGQSVTGMAEAALYGIKTQLERNPVLNAIFGDLRSKFEVWSTTAITAKVRDGGLREPTIDTTGLNTSKTGAHPDLVILDDLVNEQNYQSVPDMARAKLLIQSYYPIIERWGSLLVVGTRWGDNDVYGWVIDKDEQRELAGHGKFWDYYIVGAYHEDGSVRFPSVLPESRISELRENIEPKLFSAWILNEARAEGENIFTLSQIQYVDLAFIGGPFSEIRLQTTPSNRPYIERFGTRIPLSIIMLVDPAPTVGVHSDFTGINVVGFDPDANWWSLFAAEIKMLPTERLNFMLHLARKFDPKLIALENADLDGPLLEEKIQAMGLSGRVVSFNPRLDRKRITADAKLMPHGRTSKAAQIESIEPTLRAGRIFFSRGDTAPLVRQLTKYPYLDHDDVIDSFAMAKAYEGRKELRVITDPTEMLNAIEAREYALEGLNPDGSEIDAEPVVTRSRAGLSSSRR